MMKTLKNACLRSAVLLCIIMIACKKESVNPQIITSKTAPYLTETVLSWNQAATVAVLTSGNIPPYPPMIESRIYAMVNVAMHDALNTIEPRYERYALTTDVNTNADARAAVAQAAHDVLVAVLPTSKHMADSLLTVSLDSITTDNKAAGFEIGKASASAMLAKRAADGASTAQVPYTQGTLPGAYRSIPPFDGPPNKGYVAVPGWGLITPWGLTSGSQFRADPPFTLSSKQYAADYKEIQEIGCINSTVRTADQTQIALFWLDNVPLSSNRITRDLVVKHKLDAWKTAYLLALVQMAEADANIASFDSKFHYNLWRPITAIRLGDEDGNPDTKGDPTWNVLAPPTPPVPDYTSNHSANGTAAAEIWKNYFGTDEEDITAKSNALPNVTRHLTTFSQVADEIAISRVYVGYHFRNATVTGKAQGRKVGKFIFDHCLKELPPKSAPD
jgi:hypothetical protein